MPEYLSLHLINRWLIFFILEGAIRKTLLDYDRKFNTLTFTCLTLLSTTDATTTYLLAKALLIFQRVPFRKID